MNVKSSALTFFIVLFALAASLDIHAQDIGDSDRVLRSDLSSMIGSWQGTLTYKNYRDGQLVSIKADLEVEEGRKPMQLLASNVYPDEPNANGNYKITVTKNGSLWNKNEVISRTKSADGTITIKVIFTGRDDSRPAVIRNTYVVTDESLTVRKEVKFDG